MIAVAVSGGADSMALLLLVDSYAKAHGDRAIALTVDHGLRKASADEARQVAAWCAERGIEHHIINLPKRKKTTQAIAREARYRALADWCKAHGVKVLATAHHRGDQAETLFFRLARGSGMMGLACMRPVSERHSICLIRPLLGESKATLKQFLINERQPWIEDPSNQSGKYTRNRIRAQLESLRNRNEIEARAAAIAESFGHIRSALERHIVQAIKTCVSADDKDIVLRREAFHELPPELARLMLATLIPALTGQDFAPRTAKLERLYDTLTGPLTHPYSLAGITFRKNKKGDIVIR